LGSAVSRCFLTATKSAPDTTLKSQNEATTYRGELSRGSGTNRRCFPPAAWRLRQIQRQPTLRTDTDGIHQSSGDDVAGLRLLHRRHVLLRWLYVLFFIDIDSRRV
jgi:hypothetical protein